MSFRLIPDVLVSLSNPPGAVSPAKPSSSTAFPSASPKSPGETHYSVELLRTVEDLERHAPVLAEFSRAALEPNVYLEPFFLIPAVRRLGLPRGHVFALIVRHSVKGSVSRSDVVGFVPVVRKFGYKGVPASLLQVWRHKYSPLGLPILHRSDSLSAWTAFMMWAKCGPMAASVVELNLCPGDGSFHRVVLEELNARAGLSYEAECHLRATLTQDADAYLNPANFSRSRKETKRRERRLAEQGPLDYRILDSATDLPRWLDAFLELEERGWKGKEGSALGSQDADRSFFREAVTEAFVSGNLQMLALFQSGQPIAMKCNFTSGSQGFAFKIAYDESKEKFSPGVQLEVFNIETMHRQGTLQLMDSCAVANHPMINRLWKDRRVLRDVLLSTGRTPGDLVVSSLPLLRWFKRKLDFRSRTPRPAPAEEST